MANQIPKDILDSITYEIVGEVELDEDGVYFWEEKEHIWKEGQEFIVRHMRSPGKYDATILKPVLTPEEYERRRQKLEEACVRLLIAHERAMAKKAAAEAEKVREATT